MSNEEKLREIAVASGTPVPSGVNGKNNGEQVSPNTQARSKFSSQQGFTPKVQAFLCCLLILSTEMFNAQCYSAILYVIGAPFSQCIKHTHIELISVCKANLSCRKKIILKY